MYEIEFSLGNEVSVSMLNDGSIKITNCGPDGSSVRIQKETSRALANMIMSMIREIELKDLFEENADGNS